MAGMYTSYERRKARAGLLDFEDLLERTIGALLADRDALAIVRDRYRAFTVDEYQDVNLLQQTLLDTWAGDRRDLCVVGDDRQAIFGFTGATPEYLLGFPDRHPGCRRFRLTVNYRSTPQVLEVANRLGPILDPSGGSLRAAGAGGEPAAFASFASGDDEVRWVVDRISELRQRGVAFEEMAVLLRINGRSEDFEEALSRAGIPYQVRDSAFLRRPAAKSVVHRLKRVDPHAPVAPTVHGIVRALGFREEVDAQGDEATRQADLGRLLAMAQEYPAADGVAGFLADLARRFASEQEGRGVQLLTYHRAKGLEFDAVFLPRLEEKELPFVLARSEEAVAEERRLLYVGVTRARRWLFVSCARERPRERRKRCSPSPFLRELQPRSPALATAPARTGTPQVAPVATGPDLAEADRPVFEALRAWRLERARGQAVPAYVVFPDRTLAEMAVRRPRTLAAMGDIKGVGPAKLDRYGQLFLDALREAAEQTDAA
jgi:DNA helicase-2/ATP-dependent DNA helicase PcrA